MAAEPRIVIMSLAAVLEAISTLSLSESMNFAPITG